MEKNCQKMDVDNHDQLFDHISSCIRARAYNGELKMNLLVVTGNILSVSHMRQLRLPKSGFLQI